MKMFGKTAKYKVKTKVLLTKTREIDLEFEFEFPATASEKALKDQAKWVAEVNARKVSFAEEGRLVSMNYESFGTRIEKEVENA